MSRPEHHQHAVELDEAIPPQTPGDGSEGVREDILDEINDHLNCAMQREMRRTDDPHAAWSAVLHRFGNPRTVARQLWYLAMKETIMLQRTLIITNIITAIAVIVLAVVLFLTMRQAADVNQAILAQLQNMPAPAQAPEGDALSPWTKARFTVISTNGDKPIEGARLRLNGQAYNPGESVRLDMRTDTEGTASFGPIQPGLYVYTVRHQGVSRSENISIAPGQPTDKIVALAPPLMNSAPVVFKMQLAEDLQEKIPVVRIDLSPKKPRELGAWEWEDVSVFVNPRNGAILAEDLTTDEGHHQGFDYDAPVGVAIYPDQISFRETVSLDPRFKYEVNTISVYYPLTTVKNDDLYENFQVRAYDSTVQRVGRDERFRKGIEKLFNELWPIEMRGTQETVYQIPFPEEIEEELRKRINQ